MVNTLENIDAIKALQSLESELDKRLNISGLLDSQLKDLSLEKQAMVLGDLYFRYNTYGSFHKYMIEKANNIFTKLEAGKKILDINLNDLNAEVLNEYLVEDKLTVLEAIDTANSWLTDSEQRKFFDMNRELCEPYRKFIRSFVLHDYYT